MTTYKRPKLPIDDKKATRWALASLKSIGVGVGPVGASLGIYDLVNMETFRAHRMVLKSGGVGKGFKGVPVSGSFLNDDYTYFNTSRPANFPDFDGAAASLTSANALLYSWSKLLVFDGAAGILASAGGASGVLARVKMSGGGLNIPNLESGGGITQVLYSDGKPVETPEFHPDVYIPTKEDDKIRIGAEEDKIVIRLRDEVLFDFDQYTVKPEAKRPLRNAAAFIRSKSGYGRVSIEGHTDSKGSNAYNMTLSKHRAKAVAQWFISRNLLNAATVETVGKGESDPMAPNTRPDGSDDPIARAKNRRVEIWLVKDGY
jgi:outer membrane protein OmpA-like peptidoglycan-associated protein